ncbi:MAG: multicopper oxidase domain-containing protein [Bacteroidetes bacterium]|nr:multicopper oxidase domain-containing protein [Bacteroidota bacterium]MBP6721068.1 multicopper oxidase domain-containing protein [Bacteroidia bacterium]
MKINLVPTFLAAAISFAAAGISYGQNPLFIPDTLSGTTIGLTVQTGSKTFFPGFTTPTFGYNGDFLGPTLLMNKGDSVTLNVTNSLNTSTTVHWHGFHVAPENDGGPHQAILPGTTWSPSFKIRNEAATYWYHPHGEGKTEIQVSKGLAGLIIIRDSAEASYALPRTYGVDDFPLILQSKAFDVLQQIAIATHEDSIMIVNGTIDPTLEVPKQVVRLRVLNGSADRTYYLGMSDNSDFHLIASDGGLLSQPIQTNRVRLSTGERAEMLIDFNAYSVGQSVNLVSYSSELPRGIIGADSVGTVTNPIGEGYYSNPLNGLDFSLVRFDVAVATNNPVVAIPSSFAPLIPMDTLAVNAHRYLHFGADTTQFGEVALVDGPFHMNNDPFEMDSINITIPLNNKEIWTLTNSTKVAHPFHIHDIQFFVLDINGTPPPPQYAGLKDVILVKPDDTLRFITQFVTFADDSVPYMYHCHLLHHEDDGMMGQFLVVNTATSVPGNTTNDFAVSLYPNPASDHISLDFGDRPVSQNYLEILDAYGRVLIEQRLAPDGKLKIEGLVAGFYFVRINGRDGIKTLKFLKQ